MMACSQELLKQDWDFNKCSLMLRMALKIKQCGQTGRYISKLRKAIVESDLEKACETIEGEEHHHLNKLWYFAFDNCMLYVPPLCVAVCLRDLPMVQCLLRHGADPDRVGRVYIYWRNFHRWAKITPLMMAVEHHPQEGLCFVAAVASVLVDAGADINSTACNFIQEEEEEGGSMVYNIPATLLHKCVGIGSHLDKAVFTFVLDHGADLFIQDTCSGHTVLQKCLRSLVEYPDVENLNVCAEELICLGALTTNSKSDQSPVRNSFAFCRDELRSEFKLLLKAMTSVVDNKRKMTKIQCMMHLLLDAGYICSESDISKYKTSDIMNIDQVLTERVSGLYMYSLKHFCRLKIRQSVQDLRYLDRLSGLPVSLISFLKLKQ